MNTFDTLEKLKEKAKTDASLRDLLLATRHSAHPIADFCRVSTENGCTLGIMDLVSAGEEAYAAMRRSTNGGGENSPLLQGEDDLYEMFLIELE